MAKKNEVKVVHRTNKLSADMLQAKELFYYQDVDDEGNMLYVLLDNRKGKKKLTNYNSIEELDKAVKKL